MRWLIALALALAAAIVAGIIVYVASGSSPQQRQSYVLAISWQPGFCETRPDKPECRNQGESRFDADHFALHGLWPQASDYCGVSSEIVATDKDGRWEDLPQVALSAPTRRALEQEMPGTRSFLDRHEWIKHGTCSGMSAEAYFSTTLALLDALNASEVQALFADHVGETLTQADIRDAFDAAFGTGAGDRVRVACSRDGDRRLITELTVGLSGDVTLPNIATLVAAASPTDGGCTSGVVDPVGFQ